MQNKLAGAIGEENVLEGRRLLGKISRTGRCDWLRLHERADNA